MTRCGTPGHVHGTRCTTTNNAMVPIEMLPRTVPRHEAEILERCRAALMHRAGIHTHSREVPDMTTREAPVPEGIQAVELGTVVVRLDEPTAVRRARLTTAVGAAIGLPSPRMERDAVPGHLSYALGVSVNVDIAVVVSAWRTIAALEGVSYVRIEGLSRHGLWVVENRPDCKDSDEPWRFVLSGPVDPS